MPSRSRVKKRIATPWSERRAADQGQRTRALEQHDVGPFKACVSPARLRDTRRARPDAAALNKLKVERYGASTAFVTDRAAERDLRDLLPRSLRLRSTSDRVLVASPKPISNKIVLPPVRDEEEQSSASSLSSSSSRASPSYSHQSSAISRYFRKRLEAQKANLRISELAIRKRMMFHRRCAIDLNRSRIRKNLPFDRTLGNAGHLEMLGAENDEDGDGHDDDDDTTVSNPMPDSIAEKTRRAMLYDFLPGSSKLVKKSLYARNYKLQEYWRQSALQRAQGIGRVQTAESVAKKPNRDKHGRRRSLSRISEIEDRQSRARLMSEEFGGDGVSPLAAKFGGLEGSKKEPGVYGTNGETVSRTVARILQGNNLLDLMLSKNYLRKLTKEKE